MFIKMIIYNGNVLYA